MTGHGGARGPCLGRWIVDLQDIRSESARCLTSDHVDPTIFTSRCTRPPDPDRYGRPHIPSIAGNVVDLIVRDGCRA